MKKILATLWGIILVGVVLITLQLNKPQSYQFENQEISKKNNSQKAIPRIKTTTSGNYEKTGDNYLDQDDLENAITNYQKGLEASPDKLTLAIKLSETYLKNNQSNEARDLLTEVLKTHIASIDTNIALAQTYLSMRQIEKAKSIIWALDEKNNRVQYYRGIISILYKDFKGAKKIFETISKAEPKAAESILENTQKYLTAFESFSYYKGGQNAYLELLLAKAMTETQEYQIAIPLLYDILNNKNNYRDAWILLGYSYLNVNKINEAIDALVQAKELTPQKPETLFYLGLAYFAKDEIDKAIYYIESADKYGYEPKEQVKLKLGDLYLLKKEYQKSASSYENVLSLNSKKIDVFERVVWLNIDQLDNPQKALTLSQKALETHPNEAMSYNLVGWAYTALGNYQKGKENLDIALNIDQNLDATNLNFGWLYEKFGNEVLAKEFYKKAYMLGRGNSIGKLAAARYNNLSQPTP